MTNALMKLGFMSFGEHIHKHTHNVHSLLEI